MLVWDSGDPHSRWGDFLTAQGACFFYSGPGRVEVGISAHTHILSSPDSSLHSQDQLTHRQLFPVFLVGWSLAL